MLSLKSSGGRLCLNVEKSRIAYLSVFIVVVFQGLIAITLIPGRCVAVHGSDFFLFLAMPCYAPIQAWRGRETTKSGKHKIVFDPSKDYFGFELKLPCGRCIGCRLEYSRQWAIRSVHEASLHDANCFLTLTYDNDHLPGDLSLHKDHLQKFFKRLRFNLGDRKLRYFACGEYGDLNRRPHYHALIFGYDFPDKIVFSKTETGYPIFVSPLLDKSWKQGYCYIGSLTFESAAYVARYAVKKITGDSALNHYKLVNPHTGEICSLLPEFCVMSRRPGIGRDWVRYYHSDLDKDYITLRGRKMSLPRYYNSILDDEDSHSYAIRKSKRIAEMRERAHEFTDERLAVKEQVKLAQMSFLKRPLET